MNEVAIPQGFFEQSQRRASIAAKHQPAVDVPLNR
jgi:hypothetical protein